LQIAIKFFDYYNYLKVDQFSLPGLEGFMMNEISDRLVHALSPAEMVFLGRHLKARAEMLSILADKFEKKAVSISVYFFHYP
jgi:hypothetical protein